MKKTRKLLSIFLAIIAFANLLSTYVFAEEAGTFAVRVDENESNNSFATAQVIRSDYTVLGTTDEEDDDYFQITVPVDGRLNVWLGNFPSSCDFDFRVYNENHTLLYSAAGTGTFEQLLGLAVNEGDTLYIWVYSVDGSGSYSLRARVYLPTYTYYTQVEDHTLSYNELEGIQSANGTYDWQTAYYNEGCAVASYAMVLSNLGATTASPVADIPNANGSSITSRYLDASPFTVMMANTYNPGVSYVNNKYVVSSNADPVLCSYPAIASFHGRSYADFWPDGNEKEMVAELLSIAPQGLCLYFTSGSKTHMVVVTETTFEIDEEDLTATASFENLYLDYRTPTKTPMDFATRSASNLLIEDDDGDKFTVYDPYFTGTTASAGIPLSESYTGSTFTWYNLYYIIVLY
ncbi:MAG: hypothetical protein IKB35_00900 [Clostridia bacterium]|nr:hypothetical protein [Clostridia bacterium]